MAADLAPRLILSSLMATATLAACVRPAQFGDDQEPPHPALAELPPNTAVDVGRYRCPQLVDPCEAILDWGSFAYDAKRHQILTFNGGSYASRRTDVAVFDLMALAWGSAYAPTPCSEMTPANVDTDKGAWITTGHPLSREVYDLLAMDERSGDLILLGKNAKALGCSRSLVFPTTSHRVAHYHPDARTWEYTASMSGAWEFNAAAEYDPVSGRIVVISQTGLWTYDLSTKTIAKHLDQAGIKNAPVSYSSQLLYFPPNQRMYNVTRGLVVVEVVLDRANWSASTLAEISLEGALPASGAKGWAYDTRNRVFGGGVQNGVFYTLDPVAKRWGQQTMRVHDGGKPPLNVSFFTLAYDPVNAAFVFTTNYTGGWRTWVYKP